MDWPTDRRRRSAIRASDVAPSPLGLVTVSLYLYLVRYKIGKSEPDVSVIRVKAYSRGATIALPVQGGRTTMVLHHDRPVLWG